MDIPNVKMDMRTMSDSEIEDLFSESYAKVALAIGVDEYEVNCERQSGSSKANIAVNVVGFAGAPTSDEYCSFEEVNSVEIARSDKGRLVFNLNESKKIPLGGIDYQVVYESE